MKKRTICWECGNLRERCKPVTQHVDGEIEWVCPQCWRELDYDKFMYEHRGAEKA